MTWIEKRKGSYAVRWYVKGERTPSGKPKVATEWFDDRREAEWFASGNIKSRLDVVQRRAREAAHGMDIALLTASGRTIGVHQFGRRPLFRRTS